MSWPYAITFSLNVLYRCLNGTMNRHPLFPYPSVPPSYSVYNNLNSDFFLILTHKGTCFGGSVMYTLTHCGKLNVFA